MKKINNQIIIAFFIAIVLTACNKEECVYDKTTDVVSGCIESPYTGYMVTTSASGAKIFEAKLNSNAPMGLDWNNISLGTNQIMQIVPTSWNTPIMGKVFGIALDDTKNIFLSATGLFGGSFGTGGGSAGIYKTDITNPSVTQTLVTTLTSASANTVGTNQIPSTGGGINSIGNIAYDKVNNQLFATNLEDGRIYRIDPVTGNVKSIFDPFTLDTSVAGLVADDELIWGIGVYSENGKTKVYFSRAKTGSRKDIWSIGLTSTGEFMATEVVATKLFNDTASSSQLEILDVIGVEKIISDIEFSKTGRMLLAERGGPHSSKVIEYTKTGTTWSTLDNIKIGIAPGNNSAGGVFYGDRELKGNFICDDIIWGSGNALQTSNTYWVYGFEGLSATGNTSPTNYTSDIYIDNDGNTNQEKGGQGDIDLFKSKCCE